MMELLTKDGDNLMTVERLEKDGDNLVIHGEIMGALPVRAVLKPGEMRKALKLLSPGKMAFIASMLFRKGDKLPANQP